MRLSSYSEERYRYVSWIGSQWTRSRNNIRHITGKIVWRIRSVQWDVEIYDQESGTRASSNLELYLVGLFTGLARHVGVRCDIICLRWRSLQQETRTSDFLLKIQ